MLGGLEFDPVMSILNHRWLRNMYIIADNSLFHYIDTTGACSEPSGLWVTKPTFLKGTMLGDWLCIEVDRWLTLHRSWQMAKAYNFYTPKWEFLKIKFKPVIAHGILVTPWVLGGPGGVDDHNMAMVQLILTSMVLRLEGILSHLNPFHAGS